MAVLTLGFFSAWIVQLNMVPYVGYMVANLGIVDNKDEAGKVCSYFPVNGRPNAFNIVFHIIDYCRER